MRTRFLERVAFVVSLVLLAFLYGIATQAFGWFPSSSLQRAWNQAEATLPISTSIFAGDEVRQGRWLTSRVYSRSGIRAPQPGSVSPGLTFITSAWEETDGWTPGLRLIDVHGNSVHHWRVPPAEIFPDTTTSPRGPLNKQDVQGSYLFPDGDVLVNVEYVGTARLDACGRVIWKNSRFNFHHSIARAEDGSFWIPGVRRDVEARSELYPDGYPGLQSPIHRSLIVQISPGGEVLDTINVLDVLYKSGLHRHIPQAMLDRREERPYGRDVVHMNDVEPLPDSLASEYPRLNTGDLVVSLRKPNLVFVLDPTSHEVKWHATHPFIHQHDPDFVGDGWIGTFDNNQDGTERGTMLGGSRIVLRRLHTDSQKVLFPTPNSEPFYTNIRGKWQRLANGNLLLTEAEAGRVVEVDPEGRTVWEWVQEPAGEGKVPSVTKGARILIGRDRIESWPCYGISKQP